MNGNCPDCKAQLARGIPGYCCLRCLIQQAEVPVRQRPDGVLEVFPEQEVTYDGQD